MRLKKNLKTGQVPLEISKKLSLRHKFLTGQASLEYCILLAVIVALTILAGNTFIANVRATIQGKANPDPSQPMTRGVFQRALEGMGIIK
jgi:hypothetical protein